MWISTQLIPSMSRKGRKIQIRSKTGRQTIFKRLCVLTKTKDFQISYIMFKKDIVKHKYAKILIFKIFKTQAN